MVPHQSTQQFLSTVLSQRGPSALQYTEDSKWLIRQHLVSLIESYPSLQPKTAVFNHTDGRTVNLLQAQGTIPMIYMNVTYNIPIVIWLMETYPRHPPCIYVNPTRDMIIKRPHAYVNPSGLVSTPLLQSWIYPSSTLCDVIKELSGLFGLDPPLFTLQQQNPNTESMRIQSRPATPPRGAYDQSPYGVSPSQNMNHRTDDPVEIYKKNAINKLLESLHGDIATLRKNRQVEMEGLFNAQGMLRQREEQLSKGVREMQQEKEGLEQQLQMVLMNTDVLEGWVKENQVKVKINKGNLNVDQVFEPVDALSKQMLDCTAADLAIEDVIYSLDKVFQEGSMAFDQYLKNVRALSREQFFHRATASKVRAAQMQAQVANMASRASHSQYAM
ncbi:protein ELC-like [Papaver somniferum]|nr:protein ELC-like [Papaver somniferum]